MCKRALRDIIVSIGQISAVCQKMSEWTFVIGSKPLTTKRWTVTLRSETEFAGDAACVQFKQTEVRFIIK